MVGAINAFYNTSPSTAIAGTASHPVAYEPSPYASAPCSATPVFRPRRVDISHIDNFVLQFDRQCSLMMMQLEQFQQLQPQQPQQQTEQESQALSVATSTQSFSQPQTSAEIVATSSVPSSPPFRPQRPPFSPGMPPLRTPVSQLLPQPKSMPPLREYQKELAEYAKLNNTVIFCPTGSGKTLIACEVARFLLNVVPRSKRASLEDGSPSKCFVVFIVDRLPLVNQQHDVFWRYLTDTPLRVTKWSSDNPQASWKKVYRQSSILVIIDNILLQLLSSHEAELSDIDLLIVDECHHSVDNHAMSRIFKFFYHNTPPQSRPQILGLTASPGGGDLSRSKTRNQILKICQNMNCHIRMVQKCEEELKRYVRSAEAEIITFKLTPLGDSLRAAIVELMGTIEQTLLSYPIPKLSKITVPQNWAEIAAAGISKGSQQYFLYVDRLYKIAMTETRPGVLRLFLLLRQWNEALRFLFDLGINECRSAMLDPSLRDEMHEPVPQIDDHHHHPTSELSTPHDQRLHDIEPKYLFFAQRLHVLACECLKAYRQKEPSQKLVRLVELLQNVKDQPDFENFRGMIFTDTKRSTVVLTALINNDPTLNKHFRAHEFVGHGKSDCGDGKKIGHNTRMQQTLLEKFKAGTINLFVATSVGEEGLDISQCNLVVRYDTQCSPTSLIQSRGRARRQDSRFVLITREADSAKFNESTLKETNMHRVVAELMDLEEQGITYLMAEDGSSAAMTSVSQTNSVTQSASSGHIQRENTSFRINPKLALTSYCVEHGFAIPDFSLKVARSSQRENLNQWWCSVTVPFHKTDPVTGQRVVESICREVEGPSERVVKKEVALKICEELARRGIILSCARHNQPLQARTKRLSNRQIGEGLLSSSSTLMSGFVHPASSSSDESPTTTTPSLIDPFKQNASDNAHVLPLVRIQHPNIGSGPGPAATFLAQVVTEYVNGQWGYETDPMDEVYEKRLLLQALRYEKVELATGKPISETTTAAATAAVGYFAYLTVAKNKRIVVPSQALCKANSNEANVSNVIRNPRPMLTPIEAANTAALALLQGLGIYFLPHDYVEDSGPKM